MVLAAGQGTRMRSRVPKVLHPLAGKPLIHRVLDLLYGAGAARVMVVLGHRADEVRRALPESVDVVVQESQLGTGHALQVAAPRLQQLGAARVLVQLGDEALVRPESLRRLLASDVGDGAPVGLLTAHVSDPRGYGRVVRLPDGSVERMVEELDATPAEQSIDEVWSGTMLVHAPWLWANLGNLPLSSKGEYYLPDLVNLARGQGLAIHATLTEDEEEVLGVNDRAQLSQANLVLRQRKIDQLLQSGVSVVDPATTYVEPEVEVEPDVTIQPGCHLRGRTRIARDCEIGPNTYLVDTDIGAGSRVWFSVLEGARVGQRVQIGPFSHLRPGAVIEDEVTLGNYAEVKASRVGARTQMHHFSYVGDADVGERVNIGAGTITVNFDAETREKNRTVVGDDAAISSDTMLVAPVDVGAGAMTGAGAVVTHDVPSGEVWVGVPARARRRRRNYPPPDTP
ncbi:MAG: bifunctional UDP-N-acetylglucosamine diphosphorylase/glucosamine-1-phosphate N-acetyltransferase GlmU [Chloroflexi bacterium]|nr:bifunctional UDP-N-acetylglucosamine diphosphorylase/glucosamine-1-phosphate N-acetyltransferase GlmU [Chloroflexota bacterium]